MLIISIVGMPGSGKTTAAKIIKEEFGACVYHNGDIIRDEIKKRGLKYTKENDKKIAEWFHDGREVLIVKRVIDKIKNCKKKIAVIEGMRSFNQEKYLEEKFDTALISVKASLYIRRKREAERRRFGLQTNEYFRKRDEREKKIGLSNLIKKANYKISNNLTEKELRKKIIYTVNNILKQQKKV